MVILFVSKQRADFYCMSLKAKVDFMLKKILLRVFKSHTFMDPLLDPTTTCSSESVKVRAVRADTLLVVCGLRTAIGLGVTIL